MIEEQTDKKIKEENSKTYICIMYNPHREGHGETHKIEERRYKVWT